MAPAHTVSDAPSADTLTLPEVIFSCGVCQASVSEIYATPESNKGFHSGSGDDDGTVTRLWIAECAHVTCGKHLSGGAAPFHPQGEQPQAKCPECTRLGDETQKKLYCIKGLNEGEHDPAIPRTWFQCPPIRLDGTAPGMDAMRFQYMALARYSQKVYGRWKEAEEKRVVAGEVTSRERTLRKSIQVELREVKAQVALDSAELAKANASLKKWEERMPIINSLMAAVKPMTEDLRHMRSQLLDLGFEVPVRTYGFGETYEREQQGADVNNNYVNGKMRLLATENSSSSSRKRKQRNRDSDLDAASLPMISHPKRMSSRDMMPPPPLQRQQQDGSYLHGYMARLPTRDLHQRKSRGRDSDALRPPGVIQQLSSPGRLRRMNEKSPYQEPQEPERSVTNPVDHLPSESYMPYSFVNDKPRGNANLGHRNREDALASERYLPSNFEQQAFTPLDTLHQANIMPQENGASVKQRQPLRPLSISQTGMQTSLGSSHFEFEPKTAIPPHKEWRAAAASVSSPFFRHGRQSSSPKSMARPPTRGSNVCQASKVYGQQWDLGQAQNRSINASTYNRSWDAERPQVLQGRLAQQQPSARPQSVRELRPLFQGHARKRQDETSQPYLPPENRSSAPHQSVTSARGRITLPPPFSEDRSPEFAGMRGVREAQHERATYLDIKRSPGYIGSHRLFSNSSRRSVRR